MRPASPTARATEAAVVDIHTLSGEHAILMRDVERRTTPVLALLGTRTWPHAELGALTNFLRTTVLRQVSDEETQLYPHDASAPPFAELSADHVRLHTLTTRLEAAHVQPCSRTSLRALVDALLNLLREHLTNEQGVLAALAKTDIAVPSAADLVAARHGWVSIDDVAVQIRMEALPEAQATNLCIERLLRLQPGQSAEVYAREGWRLRAVCRWLLDFDAARSGLEHTRIGPDHVLRVACRHANNPAGVAYPADGGEG